MAAPRDALLIELGDPVLNALDLEARAPGQAWSKRTGEAQMRRLWTGWPLEHPPVPAPPSTEFTVDRTAGPIRIVPPAAKPKRRTRKVKAAQAPTGDAA